jgi:hypothetical protein
VQATTTRPRRAQPALPTEPVHPVHPVHPHQIGQVVVVDDPADGAGPAAGRSGAVCIAEQAWAPGLGWYTQRTVSVTEDQLDGLIAQLQRARAALRPARRGKILPFRPRPASVP